MGSSQQFLSFFTNEIQKRRAVDLPAQEAPPETAAQALARAGLEELNSLGSKSRGQRRGAVPSDMAKAAILKETKNRQKSIPLRLVRFFYPSHRLRPLSDPTAVFLKPIAELEYLQLISEDKMKQNDDFNPQSCSESVEERYGRPKQQQKYVSGENNGKWSEKQNTQYIVYIEYHKDKMRSKEKRRVNKLYKEMAKFIGTRNALQCRSHHQKLEDRYLYPNKIIANYKQHNDLTVYNQVKLELEEFEGCGAPAPTSHLKLQQRILQNPTQADLRLLDTNSASSVQEGSNSEAGVDNAQVSLPASGPSLMAVDLYQGVTAWGTYIYFPLYPIY